MRAEVVFYVTDSTLDDEEYFGQFIGKQGEIISMDENIDMYLLEFDNGIREEFFAEELKIITEESEGLRYE